MNIKTNHTVSRESLHSGSASSQMVMDELDKFENASNATGSISSYSSEDLLNIKGAAASLT